MALPKSRQQPVIMKLDSAEFKSIFTEELNTLASIFNEYGYEIRIAGGAVRYYYSLQALCLFLEQYKRL